MKKTSEQIKSEIVTKVKELHALDVEKKEAIAEFKRDKDVLLEEQAELLKQLDLVQRQELTVEVDSGDKKEKAS